MPRGDFRLKRERSSSSICTPSGNAPEGGQSSQRVAVVSYLEAGHQAIPGVPTNALTDELPAAEVIRSAFDSAYLGVYPYLFGQLLDCKKSIHKS